MNRVESIDYEGAGSLHIGYDRTGRAVSFEMGAVSVEYEGPDRIARIVSRITGATWSPDSDGESGWNARKVMDARLEVIQRDSAGTSHPDYGMVRFDNVSFGMAAVDPMELGVPGLRRARQLFAVAEPLFAEDEYGAMLDFDKPSNPVFQPLEYRSTNCCIHIPIHPRAIVPGGGAPTPGSGGSGFSYCAPFVPSPSPPEFEPYEKPVEHTTPTPRETDEEIVERGIDDWIWGIYRPNTVFEGVCEESETTERARLEGNVSMRNEIEVTTLIGSPDSDLCMDGVRTTENVNRTIEHEKKHAAVYVELANRCRKKPGTVYEDFCGGLHQAQGSNELLDQHLMQPNRFLAPGTLLRPTHRRGAGQYPILVHRRLQRPDPMVWFRPSKILLFPAPPVAT